MPTEHNIRNLVINKMTEAQYESAVKDADELYLTPDTSVGTVTSVRVRATSPVVSSQNTAQTSTLDTTISLANNYGDTKNPYASKTANYVLAAPNGSNGTPSFRALDKADIPLASETAESGGTTTSLVTTGEKYTWNNKQDALPSQSGNSGKFLTTDGSSMSWATVSSGSSDYTDLTNKPTINSVTLDGNKTSADLGLQPALSTQTAYTSQGSATKVPQITTNSLGQVTGITEVNITQPTVNDAVLVIQQNGITMTTFSANASTDSTCNIVSPVPSVETISTASVSLAIEANKNYVLDNAEITDITFSSCETSYQETTIQITTGSTAPTLTDSSGITWVDGSAPIFQANMKYIILIWDKQGFVREY